MMGMYCPHRPKEAAMFELLETIQKLIQTMKIAGFTDEEIQEFFSVPTSEAMEKFEEIYDRHHPPS